MQPHDLGSSWGHSSKGSCISANLTHSNLATCARAVLHAHPASCVHEHVLLYRPDKTLLLDLVGAPECQMPDGPVCNATHHSHGTNCAGRQHKSTSSSVKDDGMAMQLQSWVDQAHNLGLVVHSWTTRDEVCLMYFRGCTLVQPTCEDRYQLDSRRRGAYAQAIVVESLLFSGIQPS